MHGFTNYNIDWVVKFGGSLLFDVAATKSMVSVIRELSEEGHRLLILPGGGPTDKTIEAIDKKVGFTLDIAHEACALAQDQTGLMICDPCFSDGLMPCRTLSEALQALETGKTPVLLPSLLIRVVDPIQRTWEITSDAVAGWLAWLVGAPKLAILTNVDGIYEPGQVGNSNSLFAQIEATKAADLGLTAIDTCLASFLVAKGLDCYVLNGLHPSRLASIVRHQPTIGTLVIGSKKFV